MCKRKRNATDSDNAVFPLVLLHSSGRTSEDMHLACTALQVFATGAIFFNFMSLQCVAHLCHNVGASTAVLETCPELEARSLLEVLNLLEPQGA